MLAILTDLASGGTFLTWTLYYLSGQTHYFSVRKQSVVPLTDNPLTTKNAHGFEPNQPWTDDEFKKFLPLLVDTEEYMYMHEFRSGTKESVQQIFEQSSKVVVLSIHPDQILYQCGYTPRAALIHAWGFRGKLSDPDDIYNDFTDHFFKESKQQWKKTNLTDVWDKREFIALNFDPFNYSSILDYIGDNTNYYHVDALNLWTNFDQTLHKLFDYLGVSMSQGRYQTWLLVYNQWKNMHTKRLMFAQNFKTIVDNILSGIDFDLTAFDLDIQQEAAIQHFLIYKHNLNFKTWQLVKFTNTKQLHDLLESNIHDLSRSQNSRLTT
jgi:hypothetical protein